MKRPIIACDLDGTICKHNDFELYENTKQDIIAYQKLSKGCFTIATGRNYQLVKHYLDELKIELPIITANGAAVIDPITQEVIYSDEFPKPQVLALLDFCIANNMTDISIHTATTILGLKTCERIRAYNFYAKDWKEHERPTLVEYENLNAIRDDIENEVYKCVKLNISFSLEERKEANIFNDYCQTNGHYHPETIMNNRILIDILDAKINKGTGIAKLANFLEVPVDSIYTIGDNTNDIEMSIQSSNSIAVGNAVDSLKKVVTRVVDTIDNNGVGKFLQEFK